MTEILKSEILAKEIANLIESISNRSQEDGIEEYINIYVRFNSLTKINFKEEFDFEKFYAGRKLVSDISRSDIASLKDPNDTSSSSDNYFQVKTSLLMMINLLS